MRAFASFRGHSLLLEPLQHKPPLVLDLGASRGEFSLALNGRFGGEFHLVEPNPTLAAILRRTTPFVVAQMAVGPSQSTVQLNIAENDEASSIYDLPAASAYSATPSAVVEVEQVALQDLITDRGRFVDVLKLDIEGAEVAALSALTDAALHSVAQITVEFHCHPSFGYGGANEVSELIKRFEAKGFTVLDFSPGAKMDVLMLNRSLLSPSAAQLMLWRLMPPRLWIHHIRENVRSWRRTRLGIRPRDLLRNRQRG